MTIDPPLQPARFIRRYKRFFADVELADGSLLTVHCPNTGSMKNCLAPGQPCWFSRSDKPKRKLPGTLEVVTTIDGHLAGINTGRPNRLVQEAIENGTATELKGYRDIRTEVYYGRENSRIDLLLSGSESESNLYLTPTPACYVEVKNVTLGVGNGLGLFPDAVTTRGARHLRELMNMAARGQRAVLFFCVQHSGIDRVAPADEIDPDYGFLLRKAVAGGVEVLAYAARISSDEIRLSEKLPVIL